MEKPIIQKCLHHFKYTPHVSCRFIEALFSIYNVFMKYNTLYRSPVFRFKHTTLHNVVYPPGQGFSDMGGNPTWD